MGVTFFSHDNSAAVIVPDLCYRHSYTGDTEGKADQRETDYVVRLTQRSAADDDGVKLKMRAI